MKAYHAHCVGVERCEEGPFYCSDCRDKAKGMGFRDITLDEALMLAVVSGEIPRDIGNGERDRIAKAMAWLEWDGV